MKNSVTFTSVISRDQFRTGIWDPFQYRNLEATSILSDFIKIERIKIRTNQSLLPFEPIEYKDIPRGNIVGFNLSLQTKGGTGTNILPVVPEKTLLFGTMRSYLGNALVTPASEWISESKCWFGVNSEFVIINPKDNLRYFWWAFLKSSSFLSTLPTGTGGTRPRSNADQLGNTPVAVANLEKRETIDQEIMQLAECYWRDTSKLRTILSTCNLI